MKVVLDEIISALECVNDETQMFLNTETGETVMWMDYGDNDIDEEELEDEKYIRLPNQFEIDEYHMMEEFAYDRDERLVIAIKGSGAFRRFKDVAASIGLIDEWYEFRDSCYRSLAEEWCEDHDLEWE